MGPIGHTALSTAICVVVWKTTGVPLAVPAALVTGVMIDGDHVLDWADWIYHGYKQHMIVLFHSWELVAVLLASLLVWHSPIYVAAALGYVGHVTSDHLLNPVRPLAYFISYRAYRKFRVEWLERIAPPDLDIGPKLLWATLEPSVWKIVRWRSKRRLVANQIANRAESSVSSTQSELEPSND